MKGSPVGLTVKLMTIPVPADPGPVRLAELADWVGQLPDGLVLLDMLGLAS